jgi:hypothetical protein
VREKEEGIKREGEKKQQQRRGFLKMIPLEEMVIYVKYVLLEHEKCV